MSPSNGRSPTGRSGFGIENVSGRSRVPYPPTRIRACTSDPVRIRVVQLGMLPHPVDRPSKAVIECDGGNPTSELARLRVVGEQTVDLARLPPDALVGATYAELLAEECADVLDELADGDIGTGTQVHLLTDRPFGFGRLQEALRGVGHEREVAPRRGVDERHLVAC